MDDFMSRCLASRKRLEAIGAFGEWMEEADAAWFKHAGYDCMIIRNLELFHLCGYVGVPSHHPYYGVSKLPMDGTPGGITYAEDHHEYSQSGELLWWMGFDCAHFGDLVPLFNVLIKSQNNANGYGNIQEIRPPIYRNIEWVKGEVLAFANHLEHIEMQTTWGRDRSCDD